MANYNKEEVLQNVAQLIDKYRCTYEGFFTDSQSAAKEILSFLEREEIIKIESPLEISYKGQEIAA